MQIKTQNIAEQFLHGGGEMGKLTMDKDWSKTPVGPVSKWPQSLRTTLSILLKSKFPMFLWWGPELLCFYNDAYKPSLGVNGKHPGILGEPAKKAWPEIWDTIKPLIDQVLNGGESIWREDQLIPIYRNGKIEDVYWTFSYSAVNDEHGKIAGVLVACTETTAKVFSLNKIEKSEKKFRDAIMSAPIGIIVISKNDFKVETVNETYLQLVDKKEEALLNKPFFNSLPEIKNIIEPLFNKVLETGKPYYGNEFKVVLNRFGEKQTAYFNFVYQPITDMDNNTTGIIVVANEVTGQVETAQLLKESTERLTLATEGTQLAIWDLNLETDEIIYSPRLAAIFGYAADEMKALTHTQMRTLIHPDDLHKIVEKAFEDALKTGIYYYQARIIHPNNSMHWIRVQGKVIFDDAKKPVRLLGTIMDITDNQTAEESARKLAAIVHSSDDAIISKNLNGIITSWNAAAERIFGYTENEMIGEPLLKLIPADRSEEEPNILNQLRQGNRVDHFETKRLTKDKRLLDISLTISPVRDSNGNIIGASKIARDITRQKKAEQVIKESEEKFRLLADSLPQFIWTSDANGHLNYFNLSVYVYSGLMLEQLESEGWLLLIHPDEREENIKAWMGSVATGNDFIFEHRFRRSDGEYRWHLSRAIAQKDTDGRIQMWVGTSTDIHDRKIFTDDLESKVQQRTKQLNTLNEDLTRSNSELAQFAYVASHDLQEPLRKIQTFSSLILDSEKNNLSEKGRDHFARMRSASIRMQQLILDLLSFSRAGTNERHFEKTDLNTLLANVKEQLKEIIEQKNVVITSDHLPTITAIPFQIEQLFTNLISNAIKFSKEGAAPQININATIVNGKEIDEPSANPAKKYHRITLTDNGIGFDPQFNERIFQLFQRLHGKEEYEGTGIGLAIVKKIIDNHHGVITASSETNKGAAFTIYLPIDN